MTTFLLILSWPAIGLFFGILSAELMSFEINADYICGSMLFGWLLPIMLAAHGIGKLMKRSNDKTKDNN